MESKIHILTIFSILFLYITGINSLYHCTEPNLMLSTIEGEKLEGFCIQIITSTTLMNCGKECFYQTNCVSFNFNIETGQCELNRNITSVTAPLISSPGFLYAEKSSWRNIITDPCRNKTCLENEKCVVQGEGSVAAGVCIIYDCNVPPDMTYSTSVQYSGTVTGYDLKYFCGGPGVLKKTVNLTCDSNGDWVGDGDQCKKIKSCYDVQKCDAGLLDGEYWVYPIVFNQTERVKVYCHDLHTLSTKTYITLVHKNVVRSTDFSVEINGTKCLVKPSNEERQGGAIFDKVKINIGDMRIIRDDRTFTTNFVGTQEYATVYDCTSNNPNCNHLQHGYIKIDTRDTGLIMDDSYAWLTFGTDAEIRYINKSSNHIIELECSGLCGGCYPVNPLRFTLDPNSNLSDASANEPICV